jgi:PAS domain S-box-containing protein
MVAALLVGAAITLGARVVVGGVHRMTETQRGVDHTHQVIETLQGLVQSLVDAETGERGFLITGDERYLEPYQAGRAATQQRLASLATLAADDPSQEQRVAELGPLAANKLSQLERTIALRRTSGLEAARAVVLSGEAKRLMDEVRLKAARMAEEEARVLEERSRDSAAAARGAITSAVVGGLVSLALLGLAIELARRRLRERERAANRAQEEKERFRITLSSVGDAVVVTDERGTITMLNPVAAGLMHCGTEAVGKPLESVFRIVNEETHRPVDNPVQKVLRDGLVAGLANHTVLLWPDGGEVPIDDSAAPIKREDGAIVGVVLAFRDIRARREAERAQQRANVLLREQDRSKDRFLALLSHELRAPLSAVRNAVAVLQRRGASPAQWARSIAVIDRQAAHMGRLVDDLLDVSRIAQGKIRLEKNQVDLATVVRRVLDDFQVVFARRQIAVDVREEQGPLWIEADATRISQVAANLLQNAAKFTDAGGRVTVALARSDDRACLRVRDTGEGMDPATLSRLFQPYVQATATIRRSGNGLGLGLALSKSIVELHGGTVRAWSAGQGRGAEFVVELPLLRNLALPPVPRSKAPSRPAPLRILLIDDDEDSASTMRDLLELERHEVMVAPDGESGVAVALEARPDVVLCDVELPGIDGYEAARRIRAAGSAAMLVALTGHAGQEDVQLALHSGFHHHLAKPVELATLEEVLTGAARNGEAQSQREAGDAHDQPA